MPIVIKKKSGTPQPTRVVHEQSGKNLDLMARSAVENPNMLVPWILMASYCYYVHDKPILSDGCFDDLIADLTAKWGQVRHRHKRLITSGHLKAGTLYDLGKSDYPQMVRGAAAQLLWDQMGVSIDGTGRMMRRVNAINCTEAR